VSSLSGASLEGSVEGSNSSQSLRRLRRSSSMKTYAGDVQGWNQWLKLKKEGFEAVSGDCDFSNCSLTSLKGGPLYVGGDWNVSHNQLTSFQHCPSEIGKSLLANDNLIKSFKYSPMKVKGMCFVHNNSIKSLKDCPEHISKIFLITHNLLTNLRFPPLFVGGNLDCSLNPIRNASISKKCHVKGGVFTPSAEEIADNKFIYEIGKGLDDLDKSGYSQEDILDIADSLNKERHPILHARLKESYLILSRVGTEVVKASVPAFNRKKF